MICAVGVSAISSLIVEISDRRRARPELRVEVVMMLLQSGARGGVGSWFIGGDMEEDNSSRLG
jgi:hypothetical protein